MGRGSIPLTATPQYIMRWHHLVVLLLVLLVVAEAAKKKPSKGKKPGKKPGKPSKPKCPSDTINKAKFMKYTVTTGKGKNAKPVADQPCWFDLKRNDCAKCKPGGVSAVLLWKSGARARSQRQDVREFLSSSTLAHPPASPATGILRASSAPGV